MDDLWAGFWAGLVAGIVLVLVGEFAMIYMGA